MLGPVQPTRTSGHATKLYSKQAKTRLQNKFFPNTVVELWNEAVLDPSVSFKAAVDKDWPFKQWLGEWDAANTLAQTSSQTSNYRIVPYCMDTAI